MKSVLNIPEIIHGGHESMKRDYNYYHKFRVSCIVETKDKYFDNGYELWEWSCRKLISKDLGECYRLHSKILKEEPYLRDYYKRYYN